MQQPAQYVSDEIDLRKLFHKLWDEKLIIIGTTIFASVVAVVIALTATEIFRADALVQPRQDSPSGSPLGLLATELSAASDLGLGYLGGGDRAVALATLTSRTIIERFIEDNNLMPRLYKDDWDPESKTWSSTDPKEIPTVWLAYTHFTEDILHVSESKKTGLVTVSIDWENPAEAQQWVTELIARSNTHLRSEAIKEGELNLSYLEAQSKQVGQVEVQRSLYNLIEAEMKKLMIAKGGGEFALKTVDAAVVPKKRIRPKRTLIAVSGFLSGALVGVAIALAKRRGGQ